MSVLGDIVITWPVEDDPIMRIRAKMRAARLYVRIAHGMIVLGDRREAYLRYERARAFLDSCEKKLDHLRRKGQKR